MTEGSSKQQDKGRGGKEECYNVNQRKGSKQKEFKRTRAPSSLNNDATVTKFKYGLENNFDTFKKKMAIACMGKYKNLGLVIVDKRYYYPP